MIEFYKDNFTYKKIYRKVVSVLCLMLLSACGGGNSGSNAPTNTASPAPTPVETESPIFRENTTELGLTYSLQNDGTDIIDSEGGLSLTDIDKDGQLELYVAHGKSEPGKLFSYDGARFVEIADQNGITVSDVDTAGYFIDLDGDGWKDFISIQAQRIETFHNGSGRFIVSTTETNLSSQDGPGEARRKFSLAAGDYDLDGDLDLFIAHWGALLSSQENLTEYLWENDGLGHFSDNSIIVPISGTAEENPTERSFTPTFADINSDGFPDLLISGDFGTSQVLLNEAGTHFLDQTSNVISDEFGMGGTVADYDNDGDLDWFVSSIFSESGGSIKGSGTGNRLYQNDGQGHFSDVTEIAGVREGGWGWGSCFADFDNDGNVDLFHTNGWGLDLHVEDASRLFMSNGDGTFSEKATEMGLNHTAQGRGVVCADYNSDGKVDILIANHGGSPSVFTNENNNGNHYLQMRLKGKSANPDAVGARVTITTASGPQMQESQMGTWYLSQGPDILHFGLGQNETVTAIDIAWPGPGRLESRLENIAVDQLVEIEQPELTGLSLNIVQGDGNGIYTSGDSIPIQADAAPRGYFFSHWSASSAGSFEDSHAPSTLFTMPGVPVILTANFLPGVATDQRVSVARRWNEVLLQAIRNDYARPTVHARNLFHTAAAMYDAWSVYSDVSIPWLLGRERNGTSCNFEAPVQPVDITAAKEEALSYAIYRIINHRFASSPGASNIRRDANALMSWLDYDISLDSTEYSTGSPAAIGNYIGQCYIEFGLEDGSNERDGYRNISYKAVNPPLEPALPGNPNILDLNRWQPLALEDYIDQAGNPVTGTPEFLSPEWGQVVPFALSQDDLTIYQRDGFDYWVYHDPKMPPTIDGTLTDSYKYTFSLVSVWSSHLDPGDGVLIDISPASLGNIESYPGQFEDYPDFYRMFQGGDASRGYDINPVTGAPYLPQQVLRGDYTRVLAEFWADGPDSETPPGHWFVILNKISDHDLLQRRFSGEGEELSLLEWDIKSYLLLGGAMHDAAITAWGIKGWYDYIRPISSLRAMADRGQSSDPALPSFHVDGITLIAGYIELVDNDDPLVGDDNEHLNKIKLLAWKGPNFIADPETDTAGVDWVLAENWWPYQRPSFVTPPFAGYISGHSTYSRAAAEILTALTADPYFPGGMSGFEISANEFLVFEEGPTVDMTLQWATYRDASDQCSLSRIWGGIHPPVDDIPGRLIGIKIGTDAFLVGKSYFDGSAVP